MVDPVLRSTSKYYKFLVGEEYWRQSRSFKTKCLKLPTLYLNARSVLQFVIFDFSFFRFQHADVTQQIQDMWLS